MKDWRLCVGQLKDLLTERDDLKAALKTSIQKADFPDVKKLDDYYRFIKGLLTEVPVMRDMGPFTDKFHYLVAHSPDNILLKDPAFRDWLVAFARTHGNYLDTPASAERLNTFIEDPSYRIEEYDRGPGGWFTFNQFFTRHVKPGMRPVDDIANPRIIVSAADSVYKGWWPLDENSNLVAKGTKYSVMSLLEGSPYQDHFRNGVFTHSYLDTTDYHRFHVPVAGIIREARKISGDVIVNTIKDQNGELQTVVDVGFQFTQTRGLVIIESEIGLVALLPIGMGHVSSVTINVEPGTKLHKGEEFGYFAYGGSDMVLLFQENKVQFTATPEQHYNQGQQIAVARSK